MAAGHVTENALLCNLHLDDVTGAGFENLLYAFGQSQKT